MKTIRITVLIAVSINLAPMAIAQKTAKKRGDSSAALSSCLSFFKDFPLPGTATRFDYQSLDKSRSLLFLTHLGDNSVAVFDVRASVVIKNIPGILKPHGILVLPALNKVYVSATGSNEIDVIDEDSLKITRKIPGGYYPDGFDYDPTTKRLFVSDEHGQTVTVIDVQTDIVLETIQMGGDIGNTHYDAVSGLIYSAVQTRDEFVEIDPVSMKIISKYKLRGCQHPHGFFIEPETHYAFITGEDNASYVVFDLSKKMIVDSGKVGETPDVLAFDKASHLLYVASESGVVSVFKLAKGAVIKICESFLAPHAHTVAVDQLTHKVYFPLESINGAPVLRVMEPANLKIHQ